MAKQNAANLGWTGRERSAAALEYQTGASNRSGVPQADFQHGRDAFAVHPASGLISIITNFFRVVNLSVRQQRMPDLVCGIPTKK
jgi:hypothetical protein